MQFVLFRRYPFTITVLLLLAVIATSAASVARAAKPHTAGGKDSQTNIGPWPANVPHQAPHDVVVALAPGVDGAALAKRFDLQVKRKLHYAPNTYVYTSPMLNPNTASKMLGAVPGVLAAEPSRYARVEALPNVTSNDPLASLQWALQELNAPDTWGIDVGERLVNGPRKNVLVAVIDYAVDPDHPDLAPILNPNGWDFVTDQPITSAFQALGVAHGTEMAGCVASATNNNIGIASLPWEGVSVLSCNIGTGDELVSTTAATDALYYAIQQGADVANMSFGSFHGDTDPIFEQALQQAYNAGVILMASAGNGAIQGNSFGVVFPADQPQCIAVSAVGPAGELAFYSDFGPEVSIASPGGDDSTFSDPSSEILADSLLGFPSFFNVPDGFDFVQGTSPAAAYASGSAATLLTQGALDPSLTGPARVEAMRSLLEKTARNPFGAPTIQLGSGIIDVGAALRASTQYIDISSPDAGTITPNFAEPLVANIVEPGGSGLDPSWFTVTQNGTDITSQVQLVDSGSGLIQYQPTIATRYAIGVNSLDITALAPSADPASKRSLSTDDSPAGSLPDNFTPHGFQFRVLPRIEIPGKRMYSVPYKLLPGADTLDFLYGGNLVALARWVPDQNRYAIFNIAGSPQDPAASLTTTDAGVASPPVGIGFWARVNQATQVQLFGTSELAPVYEVPLKAGFNMVGDPYPFTVPYNAVNVRFGNQVMSVTDAAAIGLLKDTLWSFQNGSYSLSELPGGVLRPWDAVWIQSFTSDTPNKPFRLVIPRVPSILGG